MCLSSPLVRVGVIALCAAALGAPRNAAAGIPLGDRFKDRPLVAPDQAVETSDAQSGARPVGPSVGRVVLSLGGVAALIVGLGWAWRRMLAAQQTRGPEGVTLVSRSLLTPRHQVLIVRVGRRLLVVGDSGHGMNLLCEVTDPAEAAELLADSGAVTGTEIDEEDSYAAVLGLGTDREPQMVDDDAVPLAPPRGLDAARNDVRSLIERVRGLATQVTRARDEARMSSRVDS
jgi:flagellar biogenesis protein FliO